MNKGSKGVILSQNKHIYDQLFPTIHMSKCRSDHGVSSDIRTFDKKNSGHNEFNTSIKNP